MKMGNHNIVTFCYLGGKQWVWGCNFFRNKNKDQSQGIFQLGKDTSEPYKFGLSTSMGDKRAYGGCGKVGLRLGMLGLVLNFSCNLRTLAWYLARPKLWGNEMCWAAR